MRRIYILPNLFTAGSLFCGMLAIFEVIAGDPRQACWLILLSAVLDVADGAIARLTKSTSSFGLHLDSLADLVAFGVAPALLAADAIGVYPRTVTTVCSLYVVFGALRLARFNVQALREERKNFRGLPIPAAALGVTSMIWILSINPNLASPEILGRVGPPAMVVLAYLMISKISYFGFKQINLVDRQPFEILVSVIIIASIPFLLKQHLDIVLAACSWSYIVLGIVVSLAHRGRARADEPAAFTLSDDPQTSTHRE
jgi:CDP-diacylglycerol--serine O-phosphatidyltransferase